MSDSSAEVCNLPGRGYTNRNALKNQIWRSVVGGVEVRVTDERINPERVAVVELKLNKPHANADDDVIGEDRDFGKVHASGVWYKSDFVKHFEFVSSGSA